MSRLAVERQKRGWSQAEVARKTRLHPTTISHLETGDGRVWPRYARRLSRLFNVPPAELFGEQLRNGKAHR
jgi:transcriptional regulator with XRE-family HTH domain